jgi:hypothetical protein
VYCMWLNFAVNLVYPELFGIARSKIYFLFLLKEKSEIFGFWVVVRF